MNYFSSEAPPALQTFMQDAYPQIRTEAENVEAIAAAGFEVLGVHRLPAAAWWQNYYGPLREKIETLASSAEPAMRAVIADTRAEMQMFETYSSDYGYTCFIMRRA